MTESVVYEKYRRVTLELLRKGLWITTMESCTSGQIASLITDTEGSSGAMKGAFVTYSNEAKIRQGVPAQTIEEYGVYSNETAIAMAKRAREAYDADLAIGVTGSMGNVDPNNSDSIPGQVYYAIADRTNVQTYQMEIPPLESRRAYKLTVAEAVADSLLAILAEADEQ